MKCDLLFGGFVSINSRWNFSTSQSLLSFIFNTHTHTHTLTQSQTHLSLRLLCRSRKMSSNLHIAEARQKEDNKCTISNRHWSIGYFFFSLLFSGDDAFVVTMALLPLTTQYLSPSSFKMNTLYAAHCLLSIKPFSTRTLIIHFSVYRQVY